MLYHITGLLPNKEMNGCGFCIKLYPTWKVAVAESKLTQDNIQHLIETRGRSWLDGYSYDIPFVYDGKQEYLYKPWDINIAWGEWGPEHITIPGCNATGLDIADSPITPVGGQVLVPHNVDSINQAGLLLTIFLSIADVFVNKIEFDALKKK